MRASAIRRAPGGVGVRPLGPRRAPTAAGCVSAELCHSATRGLEYKRPGQTHVASRPLATRWIKPGGALLAVAMRAPVHNTTNWRCGMTSVADPETETGAVHILWM